jgi:VanZ family protein
MQLVTRTWWDKNILQRVYLNAWMPKIARNAAIGINCSRACQCSRIRAGKSINQMIQKIFRNKYLPIAWLVLVHILLLMPLEGSHERKLELIANFDKLIHFGLYGVLTTAWVVYFLRAKSFSKTQKIIFSVALLLIAIGDGIAIEFLQKTPLIHRDFDWNDALADGLGAVAGIFFGNYLHRKFYAKEKPLLKQGP